MNHLPGTRMIIYVGWMNCILPLAIYDKLGDIFLILAIVIAKNDKARVEYDETPPLFNNTQQTFATSWIMEPHFHRKRVTW